MAQETPPALNASFVQLPISQFWVDMTKDSLWHYRGESLGWIRIARFSELSTSGGSGENGTNGKTILNGIVAPNAGLGNEEDFYLNTTTKIFYGPKTNGAWGGGFSIIGATGLQGTTGGIGDTGLTGPAGATGSIGSQGIPGQSGTIGPTGPQGLQGQSGPIGFTGIAGPAGVQGATGGLGQTGLQGIQGLQGVVGPIGSEGLQGMIGLRGLQGEGGLQGSAGINGEAAISQLVAIIAATGTITIDLNSYPNILAIEPNFNVFVYQTAGVIKTYIKDFGTTYNTTTKILTLDGLNGDKTVLLLAGAAVGAQGFNGATGPAGAVGPQGEPGIQGIAGPAGATGAQGIQGIQGVQGPVGANGAQGIAGPAGATGATGAVGPTGPNTLMRGASVQSGNGSTTFIIAHASTTLPVSASVNNGSIDTVGEYFIEIDATNITINYVISPPTGVNNLKWLWITTY